MGCGEDSRSSPSQLAHPERRGHSWKRCPLLGLRREVPWRELWWPLCCGAAPSSQVSAQGAICPHDSPTVLGHWRSPSLSGDKPTPAVLWVPLSGISMTEQSVLSSAFWPGLEYCSEGCSVRGEPPSLPVRSCNFGAPLPPKPLSCQDLGHGG